jgi:LysM repeat protein
MFGKLVATLALVAIVAAVVAHGSAGSGPERTYVVQPADTLWSIATRHYAGDPREGIWKLQKRNGLASTLISPGQVLVLP